MKILIDNHNLLGDCIIFMPTLIELSRHFCDAEIYIIVGSPTEQSLCERCISKANYYLLDKVSNNIMTMFKWINNLKKMHFDLAITTVTGTPYKSFLFFKLIGVKKTVGRNKGIFRDDYYVDTSAPKHELMQNYEILRALSIGFSAVPDVLFRMNVKEKEKARELIGSSFDNGLCSICIGTGDFTYRRGIKRFKYNCKQWPLSNYVLIAKRLLNIGVKVVFLGGKKEGRLINRLDTKMMDGVINLVDKCSIMESLAVISLSNVVLGGDTGLLHCASALGIDTISIFGATNPDCARPYYKNETLVADIPCRPCIKSYGVPRITKAALCEDRKCLSMITIDQVWSCLKRKFKGC